MEPTWELLRGSNHASRFEAPISGSDCPKVVPRSPGCPGLTLRAETGGEIGVSRVISWQGAAVATFLDGPHLRQARSRSGAVAEYAREGRGT